MVKRDSQVPVRVGQGTCGDDAFAHAETVGSDVECQAGVRCSSDCARGAAMTGLRERALSSHPQLTGFLLISTGSLRTSEADRQSSPPMARFKRWRNSKPGACSESSGKSLPLVTSTVSGDFDRIFWHAILAFCSIVISRGTLWGLSFCLDQAIPEGGPHRRTTGRTQIPDQAPRSLATLPLKCAPHDKGSSPDEADLHPSRRSAATAHDDARMVVPPSGRNPLSGVLLQHCHDV